MRFRRRDHESFIGGYDPEHEMPDPDRRPRDRWQSDAYRHNARDSRYFYRWAPDRFEERHDEGYRVDRRDFIQPPDRYAPYPMTTREDRMRYLGYERDYPRYDRGYDRGYDYYDRDRGYRAGGDPWAPHDRYERERFREDFSDRGYWDDDRPYGRGGRY